MNSETLNKYWIDDEDYIVATHCGGYFMTVLLADGLPLYRHPDERLRDVGNLFRMDDIRAWRAKNGTPLASHRRKPWRPARRKSYMK